MDIKRKQQTADATWLADWLNRDDSRTAARIRLFVVTEQFDQMLYGRSMRTGDDPALEGGAEPQEIPCQMVARFAAEGEQPAFTLLPGNDESRAFLVLGSLFKSGESARLRKCYNCEKFWYCVGRSDRAACSKTCKTALWQKTPLGRKRKRQYMREWRATVREMTERERNRHKRKITRGRNLHPSLKKGE